MDMDLTWSDAARQAAIAARQARAQGRAAAPPQKKQGVPAGQKLPKLNDRQRAGIKRRDVQSNGQVTNKRAGTAIAAFQKAHGLVVTGDLNPATRKLAAKVSQSSTGHHLLAKAVHQIGRAKNGKNWKQNEKRAADLLVKHDKRKTKMKMKMKMKADLSNGGKFTPDTIDLGKDGSKWKHGYIPLNAAAVALKAHKSPGGGSSHPDIAKMHDAKPGTEYSATIRVHDSNGNVKGGMHHTWTKHESGRWHKGSVDTQGSTPEAVHAAIDRAHGSKGTNGTAQVTRRGFGTPGPFDGGATLPGGGGAEYPEHKDVQAAHSFLGSLKHGDKVTLHDGTKEHEVTVTKELHRRDGGGFGSNDHSAVSVGYGPGRWNTEVTPANLVGKAGVMKKLKKGHGGESKSTPGNIPNADKIKNAEKMFGTNSPQHLAAKKRFGGKK